MAADDSGTRRYLCSDILVLSIGGRRQFVNLEEIWRSGAILEAEERLESAGPTPLEGELRAGAAVLRAAVEGVEPHEFGWRIQVRFTDTEWTPQLFTPAHLTDLEEIASKAAQHVQRGLVSERE